MRNTIISTKKATCESTYKLVYCGVMAALICVISLVKIPFLGSKLQIANSICMVSGIMFGPLDGAITAGLGTILNDLLFEGNDIVQSSLSFITKFAMTYIAGKIAHSNVSKSECRKLYIASIAASACYVILHTGKHVFLQYFILNNPWNVTWAVVLSKIPTTCLNGIFAVLLTPILIKALKPVLNKI